MNLAKYISLAVPGLLVGLAVSAQEVPAGVVLINAATAPKSQWVSNPYAEILPLYGNLYKPGPWAILLKMGKGKVIPSAPHTHPEDRTYTVISGTWYVGFGTTFDESKMIGLPPGSFYTEPAGVPHFVMAKDDGVVVQITGTTGPTRQDFLTPPGK